MATIQNLWRCKTGRRNFLKKKTAAVVIQKNFKRFYYETKYEDLRAATILLQSLVRGWFARDYFRTLLEAKELAEEEAAKAAEEEKKRKTEETERRELAELEARRAQLTSKAQRDSLEKEIAEKQQAKDDAENAKAAEEARKEKESAQLASFAIKSARRKSTKNVGDAFSQVLESVEYLLC